MKKLQLLRTGVLFFIVSICFSCKKDAVNDVNTQQPESGYGRINFTLDNNLTATADVGKQAQSFSVTDKNQVKWTLDIPAQPFSDVNTINMTPVGTFGSSVVSCKPISGVVFSPDGFNFTAPATLTVEFPESQTVKPLFYSIKGTGINDTLKLMPADQEGKKYNITINHFSGTMAGEPADTKQAYKDCKANYDAAMAGAKALAKQPITVIEPPKAPIDPCTGTVSRAQEGAINGFVDAVCQPENGILNKILAAQKGMCLLRDENDDPNCNASLNASGLSERLVKKAQMLIQQYGSIDDYYVPVMRAVFKIAKQDAILGGESHQALLAGLVGNIYKVRDNTLKKLRDEHNYKVIPLLISLTRDYCMLSPDCDSDTYFETIRKAATFKASIITEFKSMDNTMEVVTQFKPRFQLDENFNRFTSSASVDFISGSIEKAASHARCGGKWAQLVPFNMPMTSELKIDVCEANDATISFNPLINILNTPEMQTGSYWNPDPDPGNCETRTTKSAWASAAFMSQVGITGMYDFMRGTLQVKDKDVNEKAMLIDKTIPAIAGGFTITYTVKLEHTPL
jgi:hypothetical protein